MCGGKIKVLTITTSGLARRDGISTVILDNFARLDPEKYDLQIIASGEYSYDLVQAFQNIGVKIHCLPSRKVSPRDYFKAFAKLFKEERYEAIYIHGSSAIMSVEFYIAKDYGCKVRIPHSHNTTCDHLMVDKILRPFFYRVITDRVACGIDAGKWLYGDRSFTVIKNGRDPAEYAYDEGTRQRIRRKLGLSDQCLAIGHVGNFNAQKNQSYLVDVFKLIKEINPQSKMYLMGEGSTRSNVIEKVRKSGLSEDVIFTGNIPDVPDMLQAMDVMVLPSLHEGLPLVVVEWQLAGLPCVISDKVTKECAFTDLVSFESIDSPASVWAEKILNCAGVDRRKKSKQAIAASKEAGFDINEGAVVLDKILSDGVERCLHMKD